MATEPPKKIGRYDIVGLISKGSMGSVFKGVDPTTNQVVAIKILPAEFAEDQEAIERFNRESEAVSLLNHPNLIKIVDKAKEEDFFYFVMEYVPGTSLDTILGQRRLSLTEALTVFKGVCLGLEAAHQQSIVHRDLSPRNILVSDDLVTVKIVDFGISRVEVISREMGTLSTREVSMGTIHYMAPEQSVKMADADHRSDIYSVGVLFYEMLTGRVPVGRFSLPSQLNSEVPPELDPIVLKCLEIAPNDRYGTVGQLLQDVRRLEDRLRLGLVNELKGFSRSTSKIIIKSSKSRIFQWGFVVVALAVVATGAFYLLRGKTAVKPEPAKEAARVVVGAERPSEPEVHDATLADGIAAVEAPPAEEAGEDAELPESGAEEAQEAAESETVPRPQQEPSTTSRPRATKTPADDLEVARAKIEAKLYGPAQSDLEALIEANPSNPAAAKAFLLLGEVHERQGRALQAQAAYVELKSRFAGTEEAAEGLYRTALLTQAEGKAGRAEALRLLAELVKTYPTSPWVPKALSRGARLEQEEKLRVKDPMLATRVPAALVTYRMLVTKYPQHPEAEDAWWNLGEMYLDLKRYALAAVVFERLATGFPSTRHDAWWQAGQIYDRRLDDDTRAVGAYQRVPASSPRYQDAQKRISKLAK